MIPSRVVTIWRRELININKTRDNHISRLGYHFEHFLLVRNDKRIGEHVSRFGTKIIRLNTFGLGFIGFWIHAIVYISKLHKLNKIDAILLPIGEEPLVMIFHWMSGIKKNSPKIILDLWDVPGLALEGSDRSRLKQLTRKVYLWVLPNLLKKAHLIICGVVPDPIVALGIPPDRIIKTENGVNNEHFHTAVPVDEIWNHFQSTTSLTVKLLYQGYIHEARGALSMIHMLAEIRNAGHDACLLMIGPSSKTERDKIDQLVSCLSLTDHIAVQEEIPSRRIPSVIAGADICLCPLKNIEKYRWSYPVKIYEYMAMGKAIVASSLPGTNELIQHRNIAGCLYDSTNEEEMTAEIAWLIENPIQRTLIAKAGLELVKTKSWKSNLLNVANCIKQRLR